MSGEGKATPGWKSVEDQKRQGDPSLLVLELPGGGGPLHFRKLPGGSFRMGSRGYYPDEEPVHWVEVPEFYIGVFPVTQRQYGAWRPEHKNHFHEGGGFDPGLLPAESMPWDESLDFCTWLAESKLEELPKGFGPNLPTETHWEYACRAGSETEYANGDGEGALRRIGWFDGNSGSRTHAVGELKPNDWGLYDMHGNVEEWCSDDWDAGAYRNRVDHIRALETRSSSSHRVVRGGSWDYSAGWCRSAYRGWRLPGRRFGFLGLRVCLLPGPVDQASRRGTRQQAGAEAEERAAGRGGTPPGRARSDAGARPQSLDDLNLPKLPSGFPRKEP